MLVGSLVGWAGVDALVEGMKAGAILVIIFISF